MPLSYFKSYYNIFSRDAEQALSYISQMNDNGSASELEPEHHENGELATAIQNASSIEITPVPKGYKIKPQYSEVKSRRVQLVFPPSLFQKVQSQAKKANMSVNEFVCLILDAVVNK